MLLLLWVVVVICTRVTFARRTASSQWIPKTIPFWDTLGTTIFISTSFSWWDCALQLWRANTLLQPFPVSHYNQAVWCLVIWTISSAYLGAIHEFEVRAVHVPGVSNCYADLLSRWDSCDIAGRNQSLAYAQHANLNAVPVPDDLFQFDNDFWSSLLSFSAFCFPEPRRLRRDLKRSQRSAYSCGTYSIYELNLSFLFVLFLF